MSATIGRSELTAEKAAIGSPAYGGMKVRAGTEPGTFAAADKRQGALTQVTLSL